MLKLSYKCFKVISLEVLKCAHTSFSQNKEGLYNLFMKCRTEYNAYSIQLVVINV